jgi:hypothetical protein
MDHKGVEFLILARPAALDQFCPLACSFVGLL